jgi:hypothetical protein
MSTLKSVPVVKLDEAVRVRIAVTLLAKPGFTTALSLSHVNVKRLWLTQLLVVKASVMSVVPVFSM